ncbi:hypothetical protein [Sphingomonas sp. GM_Shp_2]|uniref:hypothetical protein n=1 Tax=Sphingomonas sp. GM_Shp_2 TaxID=2937380 RepID=UPI002269E9FE|nr:hypothetical protein [Sphingomonas sp. GM_Shp_2]
MGHTAITPPPAPTKAMPWRRSRRRAWHRMDRLASPHAILAAIPSLPRAELSRLTHRMIDRMDEIDGDPDAEPMLDDDEDSYDHEQEEAHH